MTKVSNKGNKQSGNIQATIDHTKDVSKAVMKNTIKNTNRAKSSVQSVKITKGTKQTAKVTKKSNNETKASKDETLFYPYTVHRTSIDRVFIHATLDDSIEIERCCDKDCKPSLQFGTPSEDKRKLLRFLSTQNIVNTEPDCVKSGHNTQLEYDATIKRNRTFITYLWDGSQYSALRFLKVSELDNDTLKSPAKGFVRIVLPIAWIESTDWDEYKVAYATYHKWIKP